MGSPRSAKGSLRQAFLTCHRCDWQEDLLNLYACPACGASLLVTYKASRDLPSGDVGERMWRYRRHLPVSAEAELVTLSCNEKKEMRRERRWGVLWAGSANCT